MEVFEVDGTEPLGNGKYKIYVELGRDSFGKRRRRTKTVTPTSERNLRKLRRDFEIQCHDEKNQPIENITFDKFVDKWMKNHVDVNLTLTTKDTYKHVLDNHLIKHFGKLKMKEIKKYHIVEYFAKHKDEPLLPTRYMVLKSLFRKAVEWELIHSNPTEHVKEPPSKTKRKASFLNEDEIEHVIRTLDDVYPKHRIMVKLALIGGLRRAEVAGIRIESINFEDHYIYVDKQLRYDKHTGTFYLAPVKNKKPRKVHFPEVFMDELKSYVTDLKKRKMQMGNLWNPLVIDGKEVNLIIVKEDGFPAHLNSIGNEWRKIIAKYNLKEVSFHDLRHSCASLMVKKGINFKVIQERLGHANIGITLDTYSHLEEEQHKEGANVFDSIL